MMAVYVDGIRHYPTTKLRHKYWCHMIADTHEELESMRVVLGLKASWIQHGGTPREHYDLTPTRRAAAVQRGAVEVANRELGRMLSDRIGKELS